MAPVASQADSQKISLNSKMKKDENSMTIQTENATLHKRNIATSILAPLQVRDFCLLLGGQMISSVGDQFYAVALPWLILTHRGNAQELGIVLAAYGVPRIGTLLLGGVLSDLLRPRRVMLLADIMRALLLGILTLLFVHEQPLLWQLCLISGGLGAFTGLFLPSSFALTPELLADDKVQAGNALNSSMMQVANLVGFTTGGIVVSALRSTVALAVDAISFVISAVTLATIRGIQPSVAANHVQEGQITGSESSTGGTSAATTDMTFRQLLQNSRLLQVVLVIGIVGNLASAGTMEVALPALARGSLMAGASGYGLMLAAFGAGALIGGLASGGLGKLPHRGLVTLLLGLVQAGAFAIIPFAGGLPGAITALAAAGLTNGLSNVFFISMLQQQLPRHLLGRVMGVVMFCVFGLYPLSVTLAGGITTKFGPVVMFPISGIAMAAAITFGLLQGELRNL
jgi:hypothetical protein